MLEIALQARSPAAAAAAEASEEAPSSPPLSSAAGPGEFAAPAAELAAFLVTKADMLDEYFGVAITEDAHLRALPVLLDQSVFLLLFFDFLSSLIVFNFSHILATRYRYQPDLAGLPALLLQIATEVDWTSERECFVGVARQLACVYARILSVMYSTKTHSIKTT